MKLKNKRTGEIGNLLPYACEDGKIRVWIGNISRPEYRYSSLAELNKEWDDYEESKGYWYIDPSGEVWPILEDEESPEDTEVCKQIGNYFATKEEAEKAVEKLKAWKRLKDDGMRIYSFKKEKIGIDLDFYTLTILAPRDKDSLNLLFGGEE